MATTILVEPMPSGHRPQAVANVARVAARTSDVLVLTSRGASADDGWQEYLSDLDLPRPLITEEVFGEVVPATRAIARAVADACRRHEVDRVVLMDGDQALKQWFYAVPLAFGLRRRPRIHFMLTRYPAKLRLTDWVGWRLRGPKALLAVLAMLTWSLHRVSGFAGRDDLTTGWIVKRTRDPEICGAHSRDRAALREALGLPADRRLVGIFGGVSERKFPQLVWEALGTHGIDADLVLAGGLSEGIRAWVATGPATAHGRVIAVDRFLSNAELDQMVAAADVVALAMTNNGPSGIMGKALAAGVPVVTAGSEVRAREVRATDGGDVAELTADSFGAAVARVLARDPLAPRRNTVPPATADEFAETILGLR